jgi:hypothetical protein
MIYVDSSGREHKVERFEKFIRSREIGGPGMVPFPRFRLLASGEELKPISIGAGLLQRLNGERLELKE